MFFLQRTLVIFVPGVEDGNLSLSRHLDGPLQRTEWGHIVIYCELRLPSCRSNPPTLQAPIFSPFWRLWPPRPWNRVLLFSIKKREEAYFLFWKKLTMLKLPNVGDMWLCTVGALTVLCGHEQDPRTTRTAKSIGGHQLKRILRVRLEISRFVA